MLISSLQNPRIKALIALRNRRDREAAGVMVVEGFEELEVALASDARPQHVWYCPELMADDSQAPILDDLRSQGVELLELSREVFEKAAYRQSPDGWIAVFPAIDRQLASIRLPDRPLVVICEAVEKPGNLGAMLRTADAAGADAVIAPAAITDWTNPNVVRASKGTIFTVPVAETEPEKLLDWLELHQIQLIAATPLATTLYTDVDLTGAVALAVGSEKHGLSPLLLERADVRVRIPMQGTINSLNVATSVALLLYEARRQRGFNPTSESPK